jgi:S1-C subfamily serine protease
LFEEDAMRRILVAIGSLFVALSMVSIANAQTVAELFERVAPSVVEIAVKQTALPKQGPATPAEVGGIGSGFLISPAGMIMTAAHVVQTADKVAVRYRSGEVVEAKVVSSDPSADVAMIQAASVPDGTPVAKLGDSDAVQVGDQVFVVGAPFGFSYTLTVGHISGRRTPHEVFGGLAPVELLQTDAAINQGNSGGPMFNMQGEVIGIVSHILSLSGGFEGLGFVITSNLARKLLLEQKSLWSGLDGYVLEGRLARLLNVPQEGAILVTNVAAAAPASVLGLQPGKVRVVIEGETVILGGDIILAVQGIPTDQPDSFQRIRKAVGELAADDRLTVTVLRGGQVLELSKLGYMIK